MWNFFNKYSQPSVSMSFIYICGINQPLVKTVFLICKLYSLFYPILYKGFEHLQILVSPAINTTVNIQGRLQFLLNSYHVWCSFFILLCRSLFSLDITSFFTLTFLSVQINEWQILSEFVCLEKNLFQFYFLRYLYWVQNSMLAILFFQYFKDVVPPISNLSTISHIYSVSSLPTIFFLLSKSSTYFFIGL